MYRGGVGDEGDDLDFFLAGGTEINLKFEHGCDFSLRSGQHVPEAEKSQTCQRDEAKLRSLVNRVVARVAIQLIGSCSPAEDTTGETGRQGI